MSERKRMKDVVNFEMFMEVLKTMDESEFEDYISELEDLFLSVHPELKGDIC